jgi:hypothetical protein
MALQRPLLSWFSLLPLLATLVGGCCYSAKQADQVQADLLARNRGRAEPPMRAAAKKVGATLLATMPLKTLQVNPCAKTVGAHDAPERGCAAWVSEDGRAFRWTDRAGSTFVTVRIPSPAWQYARLARRNNTLILLVPAVTRHVVSRKTRCECLVNSPYWFSFDRYEEAVFLLEDFPVDRIEVVQVPIVEDFIKWTCAAFVEYG